MTAPALSPTAAEVYDALGPLTEPDAEHDYALAHLVEAILHATAGVDVIARGDGSTPWRHLLDADEAPATSLPYLAQFVGAHLPGRLGEAEARAWLRSVPGWRRGRLSTLVDSIRAYIGPDAPVAITERDGGAYRLSVRLFSATLPGARYYDLSAEHRSYADLSAAWATYGEYASNVAELVAVLQALKPGGLVLEVVVADGASYGELSAEFATYGDLDAAFADYDAQRTHPPTI